ncbi:MAG: hypothetical protein ACD_12C00312G0005 [uncultured bacterium]|nr:MAG: hypothetical protein ACD_12C00312G0005 [uncultured bacterium]
MKQLNGLSKFVEMKSFSNAEKAYIKGTRIPLDFLTNTFNETGNIDSFLELYPWLKDRKSELLSVLSYFVEKGKKESLYE